jgi:hypothetical protein
MKKQNHTNKALPVIAVGLFVLTFAIGSGLVYAAIFLPKV